MALFLLRQLCLCPILAGIYPLVPQMVVGYDGHSVVVYRVVYRVGGGVVAVTAVSGRGPSCELIMFQIKQYHTKQERRRDRIAGIVFVIAFNVIAFLSTGLLQGYAISPRVVDPITGERPPFLETLLIIAMILPWVINVLFVLYGLRFRHEFAVGFLTVLDIGMIVPALLYMLFVPAYLVAMLVSTPF